MLNIEELTIKQVRELQSLFGPASQIKTDGFTPSGTHILVLDRGFVYVGDISQQGEYITVANARNIRKWGTTKGLGELINGPLKDTLVDPVGEIIVPLRAIIHLIATKKGW